MFVTLTSKSLSYMGMALKHFKKKVSFFESSVDPYQLASNEAIWQDFTLIEKYILECCRW